eukprot:scaffold721_cov327-Prasinococcus_capsulatus_cf.AAC.6
MEVSLPPRQILLPRESMGPRLPRPRASHPFGTVPGPRSSPGPGPWAGSPGGRGAHDIINTHAIPYKP